MSRFRLLGLVTLILTIVLAGCGQATPGAPAATPAPQATDAPSGSAPTAAPADTPAPAASGGTLRIGATAAPDSLNPGAAYLQESYDIFFLVYDTLITTDLRNQAQPQLADEWSLGDDGKTWTFKLNPGAKWHDGQPLTAEDVVFTYDMIRGFDGFALITPYIDQITSVEAPDPATVVITFDEPVANTVERFSSVYILPKHIWEGFVDPANPADSTAAVEFENTEMIGSGPFMVAEYTPGEFIRLSSVKDHYRSPPKIDEVIFQVFGNGDAMVQGLRTGDVDLITVPTYTIVRALQNEPNIQVEIGNTIGLTDIIFNVTEPENCPPDDGKCTGHPALRDVTVRQAMAHATDKQQLIDTILLGLGTPGLSLVMPGQGEAFASELEDYAFDPAQANAMLDQAGYADSDGDGVREMPGDPSTPLKFRYNYPSDQSSSGQRLFELLRDMWAQIGIQIELTPLEADALTAVCCPAFDFDVIHWGWGAGVDPSSLLYIATTDEIPTGNSETGYSNPEYDRLYAEQGVTVDPARRRELLVQMQQILLRDVPYIIPYYAQNVQAYRKDRFQGWVVDPEGVLSLNSRISLTAITPVQ